MTFTIDVSPEAVARLRVYTTQRNQKPEQVAQDLVENAFAGENREPLPFWATASKEEWIAAFYEWAEGHDPAQFPTLSLEAMDRESFYDE